MNTHASGESEKGKRTHLEDDTTQHDMSTNVGVCALGDCLGRCSATNGLYNERNDITRAEQDGVPLWTETTEPCSQAKNDALHYKEIRGEEWCRGENRTS